jgi:hypothetical protein
MNAKPDLSLYMFGSCCCWLRTTPSGGDTATQAWSSMMSDTEHNITAKDIPNESDKPVLMMASSDHKSVRSTTIKYHW